MATTRLELSAQLRQATILAHDNVRKPTLVAHLEAGTLDRRIYLAYLSRLETIYSALEQALARHPSHPHLATTHHPALLARAPALANDCAYFREELGVESSRGGEVAARAYCERLSVLGESSESDVVSLLLAHSYVRYLGDLSGGRVVFRTVSKAYDLGSKLKIDYRGGGGGTAFYEFQPLTAFPPHPSSGAAPGSTVQGAITTATEIKALVQWFRSSLNVAGETMTSEEQSAIVREAVFAFELNRTMFLEFESLFNEDEGEGLSLTERGRTGETEEDADWKKSSSSNRIEEVQRTTSWITKIGILVLTGLAIFLGGRDQGAGVGLG